jgi:hypothetical protein
MGNSCNSAVSEDSASRRDGRKTLYRVCFRRAYGTRIVCSALTPASELAGYYQRSLRDLVRNKRQDLTQDLMQKKELEVRGHPATSSNSF